MAFSDTKQQLLACKEKFGKNDTEFDSKVSHSFKTAKWDKKTIVVLKPKKMFLFEKIDKNIQFSSLFLGNF